MDLSTEDSVYQLIQQLCGNQKKKKIAERRLRMMKSKVFEIILQKSSYNRPAKISKPISDVISYNYKLRLEASNVIEYENIEKLENAIDVLMIECKNSQHFNACIRFLVCLRGSVDPTFNDDLYKIPITLGKTESYLSKMTPSLDKSKVIPYTYYPEHMFQLPFKDIFKSNETYTHLFDGHFDSGAGLKIQSKCWLSDIGSKDNYFSTNIINSMERFVDTNLQKESTIDVMFNLPRITEPRDITIPPACENEQLTKVLSNESFHMTTVYNQQTSCTIDNVQSFDIWDLVNNIEKDIPSDIWEIAASFPLCNDRPSISMSPSQITLWKSRSMNRSNRVISEKTFIRHLMYLIIGIESSTFRLDKFRQIFKMQSDVCLEGISRNYLNGYVESFLLIGTCYMRLNQFAFGRYTDDRYKKNGLIFEAARSVLANFLLRFRKCATQIFDDCVWDDGMTGVPTLLTILHTMESLKYQISTVATIYKVIDTDGAHNVLPSGAALMSYLYNEISMITHRDTSSIMFTSLYHICHIYFKYIERLIFEGELNDKAGEFFIHVDNDNMNLQSRRYWDKAFYIVDSKIVPKFLSGLAKYILLCGKSLRLLKLCNPMDPLIMLLSAGDHPTVKCCINFNEVKNQKKLLDLYRTRCRFVCGEPVTFQQLLLKKEADKKAFAELATIKHAETMDKIIAERKRLAALIQAEKQHSLRMLEAAIAENKASKYHRTTPSKYDATDSNVTIKDGTDTKEGDEENEMIEYYTKLNEEVERRKLHSNWKMKRLELDQSRVELLSSEERILKHEKLELEHSCSEDTLLDSNAGKSSEASDLLLVIGCSQEIETVDLEASSEIDIQNNNADPETTNITDIKVNVANTEALNNDNLDSEGNIIPRIEITGVSDITESNKFDDLNSNVEKDLKESLVCNSAYLEAKRNKKKVLGVEYNLPPAEVMVRRPRNDAQIEACKNKVKVLGSDYNKPEVRECRKPVTEAQRQAIDNRNKVLGLEFGIKIDQGGNEQRVNNDLSTRRSSLKLNLKSDLDMKMVDVLSPSDYYKELQLETPTTAEIVLLAPTSIEPCFTPTTINEPASNPLAKSFLSSEGFQFPNVIIEEDDYNEALLDNTVEEIKSTINKHDFELNFFGMNGVTIDSDLHFTKEMNRNKLLWYTDPLELFNEAEQKPYSDIYEPNRRTKDEDSANRFDDVNISNLTACLQRSVMLPLTYQLELVNNSILTYFLVHLDMYGHMRSLKDYFFLMDGEFCKAICHNLFKKLSEIVIPEELLNFSSLHSILDKAILSSISSNNKYSENLSFTISKPPTMFQHSSPDVLQCLTLSYNVNWPLNIVLSSEAVRRYATVFQFLIKMRRISWMLNNDFQILKITLKLSREHSRNLLSSPQYYRVQIYRHVMSSLLRALENYIMTICIQTSWAEFESDLKEAKTLDDLYGYHVVYVKKVLFKCLLNKRSTPLMKLLNDVFTVILRFSHLLKTREWLLDVDTGHYVNPCFDQLCELYKLFERLTYNLHKIINKLLEYGYQPHLVELLSMININDYYHTVKVG